MFKQRSFKLISAGLIIMLITLIFGTYLFNHKSKMVMQSSALQILSKYPALPDSYISTTCCVKINEEYYLLIQDKDKIITGKQDINGIKTYYYGNHSWVFDQENVIQQTAKDAENIALIIGNHISNLISDSSAKYRYKPTTGRDLPLIVYPSDPGYLLVQRQGFHSQMETIVYADKDSGAYLRWSMTQLLEETQLFQLFLYISENVISYENIVVPGWGSLPHEISSLFLA